MHSQQLTDAAQPPSDVRRLVHIGNGRGNREMLRLMSPSDLGEHLKPFVFLDLFAADMRLMQQSMSMHPHSGIATVTVITEGDMVYDDPQSGRGTLEYGGVEWLRAGGGVWHGKELAAGESRLTRGFQLWLALPPELENGTVDSQYIGARDMPRVGPATVILGRHASAVSPVRAPEGITYLQVRLSPGEQWAFTPEDGQSVGWFAVAEGEVDAGGRVSAGQIAFFEDGAGPMSFRAHSTSGATFVLGAAIPHDHPLYLGYYSVHTTAEALAAGERRIAELGARLMASGDRRTASGNVPVFR
ncbi:pirin family protein [Sphingomonas daechungensis]